VVFVTIGVQVTQLIEARAVIVVVTWITYVVVAHTVFVTIGARLTVPANQVVKAVTVVVTWWVCVVVVVIATAATQHVRNYKQKIYSSRTTVRTVQFVIPMKYEYERKGRMIDDDDDINILKKNERMMTTEYELGLVGSQIIWSTIIPKPDIG